MFSVSTWEWSKYSRLKYFLKRGINWLFEKADQCEIGKSYDIGNLGYFKLG